ncbi:MAG: hypothetical protein HYR73_01165 [Candidatus Eisenbacteria bacterium]|nr:hypothetical protein [Candidatus Eisenbacteria bacterium]
MRAFRLRWPVAGVLATVILWGCSASPPPVSPNAGNAGPSGPDSRLATGAADTVGPSPGSAGAKFRYRFRQTLPASDRFTFYDRELSFYFRPAPDALHFQIENKQDRAVWIDWDRSQVLAPDGSTSRAAHATTTYRNRFNTQAPVQLRGLQRYSDYVLPMDYLQDPGGSEDQIHRPLLPEDDAAPNFNGREFGVDLVVRIDNQPRTYSFRFKVVGVLPN